MRLLNRTTRRLNLTSEGLSYYEESLKIIESLETLENRLKDTKLSPSGLLRVSAPVSLGNQRLGALVGDFITQNPDMSVDIQLTDRKVDIIDEGFDVALRIGSLVDSSLIVKRLAPVEIYVCASPRYLSEQGRPKNMSEIKQHRILKYSYLSNQIEFEAMDRPIMSNSGELLSEAAKVGVGLVMAPRYIVQKALEAGTLIRLFSQHNKNDLALYAVYLHRTLVPLKVSAFVDYLTGVFADQRL